MLDRDEDILLVETATVLIQFQTNVVVREVEPYVKKSESVIFAASVVENIKTDLAVHVLRDACHKAESIDHKEILIEALCHQLSKEALPVISEHMKKGRFSNMVDIEQKAYSLYTILGERHPDLERWKQEALKKEMAHKEAMEKGNIFETVPAIKEKRLAEMIIVHVAALKNIKSAAGSKPRDIP